MCPAGNSSIISSGLTKDKYYSLLSDDDWNNQKAMIIYNIISAAFTINTNQYD